MLMVVKKMEEEQQLLNEIKKNIDCVTSYINTQDEYIIVKILVHINEIHEIHEAVNQIVSNLQETDEISRWTDVSDFVYFGTNLYFMISNEHSVLYDYLDLKLFLFTCDSHRKNIENFKYY